MREESSHRLDVLRAGGPAQLDGTAGVGAGNEASVSSALQGCAAGRLSKVHRHGSDHVVGEWLASVTPWMFGAAVVAWSNTCVPIPSRKPETTFPG